jgi:hypothetical protein
MNSNKRTAKIIGVLFLTAMVTSLFGGGFLESIIGTPDYLESTAGNASLLWVGIFLELVNAVAVIGIAVLFFRVLKNVNESIGLGYIGVRIMESVFCIASAIIPILLLSLSQEYLKTEGGDTAYFETLGTLFKTTRGHFVSLLIPLSFSLAALLLYFLLYKSKLVPRFISIWGFIAVILLLILNLVEIDSGAGILLALPIILNEIFLGIWLIVKGFQG